MLAWFLDNNGYPDATVDCMELCCFATNTDASIFERAHEILWSVFGHPCGIVVTGYRYQDSCKQWQYVGTDDWITCALRQAPKAKVGHNHRLLHMI